MNLDLAPTGRLRPVDLLVAAYNAVMAGVWLSWSGSGGQAIALGAVHLGGAALPFLLRRHDPGQMPRPLRALREVYPLLFLGLFWTELGWLYHLRRPPHRDDLIAGIDLAWFGEHLNLTWMPAMPAVWFSELMHFVYFSYYIAAFLPPVYLAAFGTRTASADGIFRLLATYLSCFLWYLVFPVVGPAELSPLFEGELTRGFWYGVTHGARAAGDSLGTAFPSSHVAGVATATVIVWRWLPRPLGWLMVVETAGVMAAAVYTQNHYAIDVVAGLAWAVGLQLVVIPLAARRIAAPRD